MNYQTPRPIPKKELEGDIANYEMKFKNQTRTLNQFFQMKVINGWDLAALSASELMILHENMSRKTGTSLLILELKN